MREPFSHKAAKIYSAKIKRRFNDIDLALYEEFVRDAREAGLHPFQVKLDFTKFCTVREAMGNPTVEETFDKLCDYYLERQGV